jgi:uncharacterized protein YhbP (UPF0306 family)
MMRTAMTDHELIQEAGAFLRQWRTASIATVDAGGEPHAANVQFAVDESNEPPRLVFVSSLGSAHSEHIALDGHVALTIYAHTDEPWRIHGLQLHGLCERITEPAAKAQAWNIYVKRFTFITTDPMLEARMRGEEFFIVTPTWLRWIDNRRGFGFKREMTLFS